MFDVECWMLDVFLRTGLKGQDAAFGAFSPRKRGEGNPRRARRYQHAPFLTCQPHSFHVPRCVLPVHWLCSPFFRPYFGRYGAQKAPGGPRKWQKDGGRNMVFFLSAPIFLPFSGLTLARARRVAIGRSAAALLPGYCLVGALCMPCACLVSPMWIGSTWETQGIHKAYTKQQRGTC